MMNVLPPTALFTETELDILDLISTVILVVNQENRIVYANAAAEDLFALSQRQAGRRALHDIFANTDQLQTILARARQRETRLIEHELNLFCVQRRMSLSLHVAITTTERKQGLFCILEIRRLDHQLRIAREEEMARQHQINREMVRNLAHEIRNPLGGIRGAAQLLEFELNRPELAEYTQVIIQESNRLQALLDKMLLARSVPEFSSLNIHEVLEHVRQLILAEFAQTHPLVIERDYDISLPHFRADKMQMTQVVLNITRNAAQALRGQPVPRHIRFRTRVIRRATILKRRYKHVLLLQIIDNGPGISEEFQEKMFFPLVTGRDDGTGLGLTLAQNFIHQHQGSINCESEAGCTCFSILLPLLDPDTGIEI